MPLRVIFDRSAFHGDRFTRLQASPLLSLTRQRRLLVHHTPVLLNETFAMYRNQAEQLRQQLPFILEVCNGGWFLDRDALWRAELTENRGLRAHVFVRSKDRRLVETRLAREVSGSGGFSNLRAAQPEEDEKREKQAAQRDLFVRMREKVATGRKRLRLLMNTGPSAQEFIRSGLAEFGRELIDKHVQTQDKEDTYRRWVGGRASYPYFTAFVEGMLYAMHHAMAEPNSRIDPNAQVDIELLTYLNHADLVVSDDARFFKEAFSCLWGSQRKALMTSAEFVAFLGHL